MFRLGSSGMKKITNEAPERVSESSVVSPRLSRTRLIGQEPSVLDLDLDLERLLKSRLMGTSLGLAALGSAPWRSQEETTFRSPGLLGPMTRAGPIFTLVT